MAWDLRNVSEGQTVVASMSAQVLFQVATDLRENAGGGEHSGAEHWQDSHQPARHLHGGRLLRTFHRNRWRRCVLAAATVQNVVTYPVVVRANNPEPSVPGHDRQHFLRMARRTDVLKVPNGALRFKPAAHAAARPRNRRAKTPARTPPARTAAAVPDRKIGFRRNLADARADTGDPRDHGRQSARS